MDVVPNLQRGEDGGVGGGSGEGKRKGGWREDVREAGRKRFKELG